MTDPELDALVHEAVTFALMLRMGERVAYGRDADIIGRQTDAITTLRRQLSEANQRADAAEAAAYERGVREANEIWSRNGRETFDAMCAMRDAINEHVPMPSLESDLLQGPEASVFCATVAEAVILALLTQEGR